MRTTTELPLENPARTGFVTYGALRVESAATGDFDRAVAYLGADAVERSLFDRLENDAARVTLTVNSRGRDYYNPNTHTIHWDPHSALRTSDGGAQSPALGLGHEVDHAVERPATGERLAGIFDRHYDNREERRVITGSEHHAARTLGEDVRHDHAGSLFRVGSPSSRAPLDSVRAA